MPTITGLRALDIRRPTFAPRDGSGGANPGHPVARAHPDAVRFRG